MVIVPKQGSVGFSNGMKKVMMIDPKNAAKRALKGLRRACFSEGTYGKGKRACKGLKQARKNPH